jgi:hypothetical protein
MMRNRNASARYHRIPWLDINHAACSWIAISRISRFLSKSVRICGRRCHLAATAHSPAPISCSIFPPAMRPTGKAQWRRTLCASQSGRCIAGYVYCSAGGGESTTDLAWDGQALIYENADLLAESERFAVTPHLTIADIDIDRLARERIWFTSFNDCRADNHQRTKSMRRIEFAYVATEADAALRRPIERFPYVPANPARRDERCSEIYNIQIQGLAQRLEAARIPRAVIGLSGGLDSAQALLVGWRPLTGFGVLGPIFSRTRCPASRPAKLRARAYND